MKTMTTRILSVLLAAVMLAGVLVGTIGCAESGENPKDTTAGTNASTNAGSSDSTETERPKAYDTVEKEKFNRDFVILTREDLIEDMYIEDGITGDILDDSICERNTAILNDFGVTIVCQTSDNTQTINTEISQQTTSGLDDYDMFIGHKYSFGSVAQQNHAYNLSKITTLDLDQPWWDQACLEYLSIDDKIYTMTGDINPSSMRISSCMIFNKDLMKDLQKSPAELNSLTTNGGWTLDVLYQYADGVSHDLNGDGTMTYQEDRYGLVCWMMDVPFSFYYGSGSPFVNISDGMPELTYAENNTERIIDIYDKIYKIIIEQEAYFVTDSAVWSSCYDVFRDGRALFCDITLGKITTYIADEGMDDEYGILPIPKYNVEQEEYLSFVNGASAFVMVAGSEKTLDFVGTIMEAMAAYNYDNVTPDMFEVVTKLQAAQDPESAAMVDYILRNRIYDLAYFYDFGLGNLVIDNLQAKNPSVASKLKGAIGKDSRKLNNLIKAYEKCD